LVFLESDKEPSRNVQNEQVQQLQEELTKAQAQDTKKRRFYRVVEAGDYESLPGQFESKVIQDLTERLAELKREYARLSRRLTRTIRERDSEPDRGNLTAIQEQRKDAASQITGDYLAAVRRENLVRDGLREEQKRMSQMAGGGAIQHPQARSRHEQAVV